ncbi:vacuolar ATPase assembly integral membrane protein VMA21 isoform X2 [Zalophus californianus]|uniref:Vacuolar ATPase assembly integral membrane protein VMA21 isoform X2 n=1 Tax=Zalophus californianus TaxID=9704 RepID=A0A6J2EBD8_ZALCA|nr:vacuolar ATPase assembly integral membrane protein VMA21 isoform X2 [Zalophus californianus]
MERLDKAALNALQPPDFSFEMDLKVLGWVREPVSVELTVRPRTPGMAEGQKEDRQQGKEKCGQEYHSLTVRGSPRGGALALRVNPWERILLMLSSPWLLP